MCLGLKRREDFGSGFALEANSSPSSRCSCFSIPLFPSRLFAPAWLQGILTLCQGASRLKTPRFAGLCHTHVLQRLPLAKDYRNLASPAGAGAGAEGCPGTPCSGLAQRLDLPWAAPGPGGLSGSQRSPGCSKAGLPSVQRATVGTLNMFN